MFNDFITLAVFGSTVLTLALSTTQLLVSSLNYPGGEALSLLHNHVATIPNNFSSIPNSSLDVDLTLIRASRKELNIHVDVLSCMTGITRFLQRPAVARYHHNATTKTTTTVLFPFRYDKTEDPETLLHPGFWSQFDYALMEEPGKAIGKWEIVRTVYGFAGYNELLRPGDEVKPSFPYSGSGNDTWHGVEDGAFGYVVLRLMPSRYSLLTRWDLRISKVIDEWSKVSRYEMLVLLRTFVRKYTGGWWYGPRMEPKIYILRQIKG